MASAGGSIGLLAGGVLTQAIDWHWIFFVNVPSGIATAVLALRLLDRDTGIGFGRGADVLGAVLIAGARMLLVYAIVEPAAELGWGSTRTLALGAGALALVVVFVAREATARNPLIPLRIFRSRNVSGAKAIQALVVAGMFGMFFIGALYLERVLEYDPLETGLAFLPATIVMGALSLQYSERLITRFGARGTLLPGLTLVTAGLLLFTRAPVDGDYLTHVLPVMLLLGTGVPLAFPALMTLSMSGATPSDAGLASGLVNSTLQVGGALGLAVLATFATTKTDSLRDGGDPMPVALNGGFHLAYLISAGLLLAAIAVAVTVLQHEHRAAKAVEADPVGAEPASSDAVS